MKLCACGERIPGQIRVDGKVRNLCNRRKCLKCWPFKHKRVVVVEVAQAYREGRLDRARVRSRDWYYATKERLGRDPVGLCRAKRKAHVVKLIGSACQLCGYSKCLRSLSFHHVKPLEKERPVPFQLSLPRVLRELQHCVLICANCHGEVHEGLVLQERLVSLMSKVEAIIEPLHKLGSWEKLGLTARAA